MVADSRTNNVVCADGPDGSPNDGTNQGAEHSDPDGCANHVDIGSDRAPHILVLHGRHARM